MPAPGTNSWRETFLGLPAATNSLDGGTDYAFGGATTIDGTSERTVISNPEPFLGGELTSRSITSASRSTIISPTQTVDPVRALHRLGRRQRSLRRPQRPTYVVATGGARRRAGRRRLARAGACYILVPNVPPLGLVPNYQDDIPNGRGAQCRRRPNIASELNTQLDAAVSAPGGRRDHHHALSARYLRALLPARRQSGRVRFHQHQRHARRASWSIPINIFSGTTFTPPQPAIIRSLPRLSTF